MRLVIVHGAADFDSRGASFEDHVSVERGFQAMSEIKAALDPARAAAVERGEIQDISVQFTFGGIGTRGAANKNPSSEAERAVNRFVSVRLSFEPAAKPATGVEIEPDASDDSDQSEPVEEPSE